MEDESSFVTPAASRTRVGAEAAGAADAASGVDFSPDASAPLPPVAENSGSSPPVANMPAGNSNDHILFSHSRAKRNPAGIARKPPSDPARKDGDGDGLSDVEETLLRSADLGSFILVDARHFFTLAKRIPCARCNVSGKSKVIKLQAKGIRKTLTLQCACGSVFKVDSDRPGARLKGGNSTAPVNIAFVLSILANGMGISKAEVLLAMMGVSGLKRTQFYKLSKTVATNGINKCAAISVDDRLRKCIATCAQPACLTAQVFIYGAIPCL